MSEGQSAGPENSWMRERIVEPVKAWWRGGFFGRRRGQAPERDGTQIAREDPRDVQRLAELGEGVIRIIPYTPKEEHEPTWKYHFPYGREGKESALKSLLEGTSDPGELTEQALRPDVLLYKKSIIQGTTRQERQEKLAKAETMVMDQVTRSTHYDFKRFAQFAAAMRDLPRMSIHDVEVLYDTIASGRIYHEMMKSYDFSNRVRIQQEHQQALPRDIIWRGNQGQNIKYLLGFAERQTLVPDDNIERYAEHHLGSERTFGDSNNFGYYQRVLPVYQEYARTGSEDSFQQLITLIRNYETLRKNQQPPPPTMPPPPEIPEPSSLQPGQEKEPDIEREGISSRFEVVPSGTSSEPMLGYYVREKSSNFDSRTRTWREHNTGALQLAPYYASEETAKQTIYGITTTDAQFLPVPPGYVCDTASTNPAFRILRDAQTGCFAIESDSAIKPFTIDIMPESQPFIRRPLSTDSQHIHQGQMSDEIESLIQNLSGTPQETMDAIKAYITNNHHYPETIQQGDADKARRRNESTSDNYIQTLEQATTIDYDEAMTLGIALLRHAGIPARAILGYHVDNALENKIILNTDVAHAWAEVWDGSQWRLVDFIPPKLVVDGENVRDTPDIPGRSSDGATDDDLAEAEGAFTAAQEAVERAKERNRELERQLAQLAPEATGASFVEVEDLLAEVTTDPTLFEDQKDRVKDVIRQLEQAKRDKLKDDLNRMLKDGFIDQDRTDEAARILAEQGADALDSFVGSIAEERKRFDEYETRRIRVQPLVDQAYEYILPYLPINEELRLDHDTLGKRGRINTAALTDPNKLLSGRYRNPLELTSETIPELMMIIAIDISNSMAFSDRELTKEDQTKIDAAVDVSIWANELFTRIQQEHGYTQFALYAFGGKIIRIKGFDEEYDSTTRYTRKDGSASTVKANLMQVLDMTETINTHHALNKLIARIRQEPENRDLQSEFLALDHHSRSLPNTGTDILGIMQQIAKDLHEQRQQYPQWFSSVNILCDGGDAFFPPGESRPLQRAPAIRAFANAPTDQGGLGNDNLSMTMIGDESQRSTVANLVGDKRATVADTFEKIVQQTMERLVEQLSAFSG